MNNDDSRGNQNYQHRKPSSHKNSYSPNSVYYGNSNHNQQQQQKKKHFGGGHNKGSNNNDRIMKQNDTIIRLLKEIRDRLPAPAGAVGNDNDFDQRSNPQSEKRLESRDNDAVEMDNDENEDTFGNTEEDSFEVENEQD